MRLLEFIDGQGSTCRSDPATARPIFLCLRNIVLEWYCMASSRNRKFHSQLKSTGRQVGILSLLSCCVLCYALLATEIFCAAAVRGFKILATELGAPNSYAAHMDDNSESDRDPSTIGRKGSDSNPSESVEASASDIGGSTMHPASKLGDNIKFNSQFSLPKTVKLIARLLGRQKDIVESCGFGSILSLKCTSIPNSLILWIVEHYDSNFRLVKAADNSSFKIDAIIVHQILGVPYGGKKVPDIASSQAKSIILKDTNQTSKAAKIDDLIAMANSELVGDKFAGIFLLIVLEFLCSLLPTPRSALRCMRLCTLSKI